MKVLKATALLTAILALTVQTSASPEVEESKVEKGAPPTESQDKLPSKDEAAFDALIGRYAAKLKAAKANFFQADPTVVSFSTTKGPLTFNVSNIRFGVLKNRKAAWINIGKQNSPDDGDAVKAWLSECRETKKRAGFVVERDEKRPSEYGTTHEVYMRRGDDYFITILKSMRTAIPESEDAYSWLHTYSIEMGRVSRKKVLAAETAADKLGE